MDQILSMIRPCTGTSDTIFNQRIRDRICDLAEALPRRETPEEFKVILTQFYKEFGVGKFGFTKPSDRAYGRGHRDR